MAVHLSCSAPALAAALLALAAVSPASRAGSEDATVVIHVKRAEQGGSDSNNGLTWATAKATVTAALAAAAPNGQIWVAAGMYPSGGVQQGVSLYGGFAGTETDPSQRNPASNSTTIDTFSVAPNTLSTSVVDGLYVTNTLYCEAGSQATIHNVMVTGSLMCFGGSPRVSQCNIGGLADLRGSSAAFTGSHLNGGLRARTLEAQGSAATLENSVLLNGMRIEYLSRITVKSSELSGALLMDEGTFDITSSTLHGPLQSANSHNSRVEGCTVESGLECTGLQGSIASNTITNSNGPGIRLYGGQVSISNNRIRNCPQEGIVVGDGDIVYITGNVVTNNAVSPSSTNVGVSCVADYAYLYNNTISFNPHGGIYLNGRAEATMVNNIVWVSGVGVNVLPGLHGYSIRNNAVAMNPVVNWAGIPDQTGHNGNLGVEDLRLADDGLHLLPDSPCIDAGDDSVANGASTDLEGLPRIWGSHVDIGACEFVAGNLTRVYVNPAAGGAIHNGASWATAFHTIGEAIHLIQYPRGSSGAEVWVAQGTYSESVLIPSGTAALLLGGFAGNETDKAGRDPAARVTTIDGLGAASTVLVQEPQVTVDGFRIVNGGTGIRVEQSRATLRNNIVTSCGTGIVSGVEALVERTTVTGNALKGIVGGSRDVIDGCTITHNGGDGIEPGMETTIRRSEIAGNGGGGIQFIGESVAYIEGNRIHDNQGAGIYAGSDDLARVRRNVVYGNGGTGIHVESGSFADITGNLVFDNADGVFVHEVIPIRDNTIVVNRGVGLEVRDAMGSGDVVNNIVAFNGAGVKLTSPGPIPLTARNNDVYQNTGGNWQNLPDPTGTYGNISADPKFVKLYNSPRDFRLLPGSPCLDAGDDSVVAGGALDLDGNPRIHGAHVDIGAYERTHNGPWHVSPMGDDLNDGASWATAKRTIGAGIAAAGHDGEVWVAGGTYMEHISLPPPLEMTIDPNTPGVRIYGGFAGTGANPDARDFNAHPTVIDGGGGAAVVSVPYLAWNTGIDGCTIRNGVRGISTPENLLSPCSVFITNDTIVDNTADGIYLSAMESNDHPLIANNLVARNGTGINISGTRVTIANNTIVSNTEGMRLAAPFATVANNAVAFNGSGVTAEYSPPFRNNCVYGNTADYVGMPNPTGTNGNISADPLFANRAAGNYRLSAGSPCIDAGDDAFVLPGSRDLDGRPRQIGAHVDIGAYEFPAVPDVYRVDEDAPGPVHDGRTWATAFRTVQEATDLAFTGDEVWVASGEYIAPIVIRSGASLYGGFRGDEMFRDQRDPSHLESRIIGAVHVVPQPGGPTVRGTLDGLYLTMGHLTLDRGSLVSIRNNQFLTATIAGQASVEITGNILSDTSIRLEGAETDFVEFLIADNTVSDGSLYLSAKPGAARVLRNHTWTKVETASDILSIVEDNVIQGDLKVSSGSFGAFVRRNLCRPGGSILCTGLEACEVTGNVLDMGGSGITVEVLGSLRIEGNYLWHTQQGITCRNSVMGVALVCNNVVEETVAGGIRAALSGVARADIWNNTVVEGAGTGDNAAVVVSTPNATLYNNIVAFNKAGFRVTGATPPAASHNLVYQNTDGDYSGMPDPTGSNGNLRANPMFSGSPGKPFHLLAGSPCRDAGDDAVMPAVQRDKDGSWRCLGAHVDIGAYEYVSPFAFSDVPTALRLAAGLATASPQDLTRYEVAGAAGIGLDDATRIIRMVFGLEPM